MFGGFCLGFRILGSGGACFGYFGFAVAVNSLRP